MSRRIIAFFFGLLLPLHVVSAQAPEKKLLPAQNAAAAALNAQMSQEGHDCPEAKSQHDWNICLDKVALATRKDFETFYRSLESLLNGANVQKLRESQEQWNKYRDTACEAVDTLWDGGSGRNAATARCTIHLTRSRIKDLDALYDTVLHD